MKTRIQVVAAVFHRWEGGVFQLALFQRKLGDSGAGLWEFPGGKVEKGESFEQALVREMDEELSLKIRVGPSLGTASQELPHRILDLQAYWVSTPDFNWTLNEHDGVAWVDEKTWSSLTVAPLDIPLLEKAFREKFPGSGQKG